MVIKSDNDPGLETISRPTNNILYHAIENTANQNTGNPCYIRRYYTQSSHRALRSCSRRNFVSGDISSLFKVLFEEQRRKKKTNSDVSKFVMFVQEPPRSEKRSLTEIPPAELDNYLCHFILEIRKVDGEQYESDSLSS